MSKLRHPFLFLAILLSLAVGCEKPPELGRVTGTVTQNGKPMPEVRVLFVPMPDENGDGVYSDCYTGEDGKYDLIYSGITDEITYGALVATHTVVVEDSKAEESRGEIAIRIPDRFSSGARSPLNFTVEPGDNVYEIEVPKK